MGYVDENGVITLTNEIKAFVQASFLDMLYPVGSVYLSVESTSPAVLFGGSWEQIKDTFLLSAGNDYIAGTSGGKAIYSAIDMPSHSHTRGTMEIVGTVGPLDDSSANNLSGACYNAGAIAYDATSTGSGNGWKMGFEASRGWTGETSVVGTNTYATILPPYLVVYMWKRTA